MNNLIVTISDYTNYGNRLQNYALQAMLSEYGDTTTAHHQRNTTSNKQFIKEIVRRPISALLAHAVRKQRLLELKRYRKCLTTAHHQRNTTSNKQFIKEIVRRPISALLAHAVRKQRLLELKRYRKCLDFSKRYVPDSQFLLTDYGGLQAKKGFTYNRVIIGSDQVWNPLWITKRDLALRLGSFAPSDCTIISYAASFGVDTIDDDAKQLFQEYLPRFSDISVREFRGAELVEEMTGLTATVVLDPTLMIDADKWLDITEHFVPNDEKYILTYFLGKATEEQENSIRDYAKVHGCQIRRILDLRDPATYVAGPQDFVELFAKASYTEEQENSIRDYAKVHGCQIRRILDLRDPATYVAGPQDFVELFAKASYVFTDSYHACCFSMLFHKQFTVYNRAKGVDAPNMNSRMETIFKLFDLNHVMMDSGIAPEIEYAKIDGLLDKHREESKTWLDRAMRQN